MARGDGSGRYRELLPPEELDAEDPLFILYTSGSTGKPKGVLHTTAGYLLFTHLTFKWIFDYHEEDLHFCTADIGWITGHSYVVYGPLSNGATSLMFEGVPTYPEPDRLWDICDKHQVNILYTAPTVIRALMGEGSDWVAKHSLKSLRLLGSVGEPINRSLDVVLRTCGPRQAPYRRHLVADGDWRHINIAAAGRHGHETGFSLPPFPVWFPGGAPGWHTRGYRRGGYLVIDKPWPGMIRGTYGDPEHKRVKEVYFERFPGKYFSGDGASIDPDGDYWLQGRIDDVVNVSGHRMGTAEIESALVSHEAVAEAAVVGFPHEVKGEGIYAYVNLIEGYDASEDMRKLLRARVQQEIGPIAKPDKLQFVAGLPKTRSGKIMRRILRKIAAGQVKPEELGDTSTLADPGVVDEIVAGRL